MIPFLTFYKNRQSLWLRILLAALLGQNRDLPEGEVLE